MAFEENGAMFRRTEISTADLSAKQFYAVDKGDVATAGKACDGILQNNPASGKPMTIQWNGVSKGAIAASQTITKGDLLEVTSGGTLIPLASGTAVARAEEALVSVAAVRIIGVMLLPGSAVHT